MNTSVGPAKTSCANALLHPFQALPTLTSRTARNRATPPRDGVAPIVGVLACCPVTGSDETGAGREMTAIAGRRIAHI